MFKTKKENGVFIKAYQGDSMTLLAFDIEETLNTEEFVGFTLEYRTPSGKTFPIVNKINFKGEDKLYPSREAPIQKFRWLHVPGNTQQTLNNIEYGEYTYLVTPRYYDLNNSVLRPLDETLTSTISIQVGSFLDGPVELAFTRSYVNSQAYIYRFGANNKIIPEGNWLFDTSKHFVTYQGKSYSYEDLYMYLGFTARKKILDLLEEALKDKSISLEMFIYDFDEPRIADYLLKLAGEGRIRIISDDYIQKVSDPKTGVVKESGHGLPGASETKFVKAFSKVMKGNAAIVRGNFSRFQHHKVMIFLKNGKPFKVLSGSTNFSITGLCVNSNHLVVFNDPGIASLYSKVFNACWGTEQMKAFKNSILASRQYKFSAKGQGPMAFSFSPHKPEFAATVLDGVTATIEKAKSSVLFSVMQMSGSGGSVMPALASIQDKNLFSYGVSDQVSRDAVALYKPGSKKGILVNAKSISQILPPPFKNEVTYAAHKIHHKFVVTDFNDNKPAVFFGSSNLALGGEKQNGDNLICIRDTEVATVFAIEALRLVDHFHFRASQVTAKKDRNVIKLKQNNEWAKEYFDPKDIRFKDRKLFV
ncbi:MAG: phospholipase D-like domain-containing protein [Flavisolibacter sp.]